jgi:hypothetical protein
MICRSIASQNNDQMCNGPIWENVYKVIYLDFHPHSCELNQIMWPIGSRFEWKHQERERGGGVKQADVGRWGYADFDELTIE